MDVVFIIFFVLVSLSGLSFIQNFRQAMKELISTLRGINKKLDDINATLGSR